MENPGVITFNDSYLYQEAVSVEKMVQLGVVIAHECAHNWFGDYVTMKWWDDLWLNESFADFMAYSCIDAIKGDVTTLPAPYTSGWLSGLSRAVGGFREDQMSTTHAVRDAVANTSLAKQIFDGITYRKGMIALKQLVFIMTEAKFFSGVQDYFKAFAWSNGTIDDFLAAMSKYFTKPAADYSLDLWKQMWLLEPSLDVLSVEWDPSDISTTAPIKFRQAPFSSAYPLLRYHKINVAFIRANGTFVSKTFLVGNREETVGSYNGSSGIKAVLINYDLQGFLKYDIDPTSLAFLQSSVSTISGNAAIAALARMVAWFYMNEMVRDGKAKVLPHRQVIFSNLPAEKEDTIYDFQLQFLSASTASYLPMTDRPAARSPCFDFLLAQLQSMTTQTNRIKILQDALPGFCSSPGQVDILEQWRQGNYAPLTGFPITPSQAFAVVKLVYTSPSYTSNQRLAIFDDQEGKNPGIVADLTSKTCQALDTTELSVFDIIYSVFNDDQESLTVKGAWAQGWNSSVHLPWLVTIYKPKIFEAIPALSLTLTSEHFQFFYTNLAPIDDDLATNINYYQAVSLPGSNMIGHVNNIKKIVDGYKLRQVLYAFNQ
jgi:aminopeptidase N